MKIGVVLEGGGMRGMYTSGVMDAFLENNINVDGIIGVSAGALFGVNYVTKQKGRAIRYNKKYAKEKKYMGLYSLITTGNIVNKDFAYYEVPMKLDVFDDEKFKKSEIDFYATVTNVESGTAEYIKLKSVFDDMEVLRATSAMPGVSEMIKVKENKYLDGAIVDSIPFQKMIDLGYDKIIVVLTRPLSYRKKQMNKFLMTMIYRKYPLLLNAILNRHKMYNRELDEIIELEKKKKIVVIRPSRKVKISRLEKDPDVLQEMYDLGVSDCMEKLGEIKKYIKKD